MAGLRRFGIVASLVASGIALSACGSGSAVSEARTSCHYVHGALVLQAKSEAKGLSPAAKNALQGRAMAELLKGTSSAAAATSSDGSWNPLMTTISEAERVPLQDLVPALTRMCEVANSSTPYL